MALCPKECSVYLGYHPQNEGKCSDIFPRIYYLEICVYVCIMDWQTLDFLFPVLFSKLGEVPRDFLQDILPAKKERDWQTLDFLFQAPITPMLLYECKIWGPSITENTWNELKGCRYWKQLATAFLRIKVSTLYEILLA